MTSLKQPHFHEDYHRPRANDRRSPPREKKAGADKATDVTDGLFFTHVRRRRLVTTPRVTQRCSIHGCKKKRRKREWETATVCRSLPPPRLKKPKFRRDEASGQRGGANYIRSRRIEFSEATCKRTRDRIFREHVFAGDCGSRRDAGSVGVSRPCATGSGRANTETNSRHHHQPSIHPSTTHYHRQRCRTLSSDAVASTTISSSLPPLLLPHCHCQRCSANPPILYPSTAIHRHHQYHHLQFSCRWRASLPPPVFDAATPHDSGTAGRYWRPLLLSNPLVSFFSIHLRTSPSSIQVFPSLLHLSFECMCK